VTRNTLLRGSLLPLIFAALLSAQSRFPRPPQSAERTGIPHADKPPAAAPSARIDFVQLQREAREMSDLAQTIPNDISQVNQGLMPKDTLDKLKRIEKLSKHMRGELNP